jgi:hypothetical protein
MSKQDNIDARSIAISMALETFLDARQTAEALHLWHEKYARQPIFSVQYFARDCCLLLGVDGRRSDLIKNLVRELYTQLHTLDQIQFDHKK